MLEPGSNIYRGVARPNLEFGSHLPTAEIALSPFSSFDWRDQVMHTISHRHGRSVEVHPVANKAIWEDPNGILFGSISYKGLPLSNAVLQFDEYSPFGLRVHGLKDRFSSERVDRASKAMRAAGLGTERVTEKTPVKQVIFEGKPISVQEWRDWHLQHDIELKDNDGKVVDIPRGKINEYVSTVEFEVSRREYQVGERIADIVDASNTEAGKILALGDRRFYIPAIDHVTTVSEYSRDPVPFIEQILEKYRDDPIRGKIFDYPKILNHAGLTLLGDYSASVSRIALNPDSTGVVTSGRPLERVLNSVFPWLNLYNRIRAQRKKAYPWDSFKAKDTKSVVEYLETFLPFSMGNYLGVFQANELTIGFATPHNWSAAATLYDLDSAEGRPVGDPASSINRIATDVGSSLRTLFDILSLEKKAPDVTHNGESTPHFSKLAQLLGKDLLILRKRVGENFLSAFIHTFKAYSSSQREITLRESIVEELIVEYKDIFEDVSQSIATVMNPQE